MNHLYPLIILACMGARVCLSNGTLVTVVEGGDAVLACKAATDNGTQTSCYGASEIRWTANDSLIVLCTVNHANYPFILNKQTGALSILNVRMSLDDATFTCHVFEEAGESLHETKLIVRKRTLVVETVPLVNAVRWKKVTLQCFVNTSGTTGGPEFTYRWLLGNKLSPLACEDGDTTDVGNFVFNHDSRSCNLTILQPELSDEGSYRCEVNDSVIMNSSDSHLVVKVPPIAVIIVDSFTGDILLGNVYVKQDTSYNFTCLATDINTTLTEITWLLGEEISHGNREITNGLTGVSNASSTVTVRPITTARVNLTCAAAGAGNVRIATTITLIRTDTVTSDPPECTSHKTEGRPGLESTINTPNTSGLLWSTLVVILTSVTAVLVLLVLFSMFAFWKRRKGGIPSSVNTATVHFRRIGTSRPTAAVNPVPNVAQPSSTQDDMNNIYVDSATMLLAGICSQPATPPSTVDISVNRDIRMYNDNGGRASVSAASGLDEDSVGPGTSSEFPALMSPMKLPYVSDDLVYADLRHTTDHPADSPPIRTEPPTKYADIRNYLLHSFETPSVSENNCEREGSEREGKRMDDDQDKNGEQRAPPLPLRGNPIPPPPRDWQL